ncbi:phage tail family protein [Kitasatospora indigofera]|uniref:phage tail protein n=1 Tax=Kitasatospora indigofera TaxID=67307 RepID=UPI003697F9A5
MAGELVTTDGQIQWGNLLLGEGSPYAGRALTGWDSLPDLDDGSTLRAQQHGSWPGQLLARPRVLAFDFELIPESQAADSSWPTYLAALRAATTVAQDEQALVIQLAGQRLLVMARVTRRIITADQAFTWGHPKCAIEWTCSDPRRYEVNEQSTSAVLPTAETGLSFGSPTETGLSFGSPVETGLNFGTAGATGNMTIVNAGDTETYPVIEIRGPVTTPTVVLGSLRLEYAITLGAADTLIVDTRAGTVTLGGQSRIHTATARSVVEGAFLLPPGTSTVSFRADPGSTDPAAQATVRWRSAYL